MMSTLQGIEALLGVLRVEVNEATEGITKLPLREFDGLLRNIETDVERLRQEFDEVLRKCHGRARGD